MRTERTRDLLVAGHVNVDRRLAIESFPGPDRTVPASAARPELGGTGCNLARVAAGAGVRTGLFARIGDGFPAEFLARIGRAGIDRRGIRTIRGISTPTCFILEDRAGRQRTLIDQGAMGDDVREPNPPAWLREYAWLHVGTGPPAAQLRLARRAREGGLRVAADPAQEIFYRWSPPRLRELLRMSELLFGNRAEIDRALELAEVTSIDRLLELVPCIVRTEGAAGASVFSRAGRLRVPTSVRRRSGSFVGAGDAFRGGFYAAFLSGAPMAQALRAGHRAAARWIAGRRA